MRTVSSRNDTSHIHEIATVLLSQKNCIRITAAEMPTWMREFRSPKDTFSDSGQRAIGNQSLQRGGGNQLSPRTRPLIGYPISSSQPLTHYIWATLNRPNKLCVYTCVYINDCTYKVHTCNNNNYRRGHESEREEGGYGMSWTEHDWMMYKIL